MYASRALAALQFCVILSQLLVVGRDRQGG